ncbi:MAG: hypothetical protein HY047_15110, partial [Acidobacteria bacterium]|nr:hypothetical protein [Acidobacteriota bacterium]
MALPDQWPSPDVETPLRGVAHNGVYRATSEKPKICDVEWVSVRRPVVTGGWWLVAASVTLSSQTAPQRPALPALPLTQLDDRAPAADLDNRTFTLTFAQPV